MKNYGPNICKYKDQKYLQICKNIQNEKFWGKYLQICNAGPPLPRSTNVREGEREKMQQIGFALTKGEMMQQLALELENKITR